MSRATVITYVWPDDRPYVEALATQAREQRQVVLERVDRNKDALLTLLADAQDAGISMTRFSELTGVSRQTLYKWIAQRDRKA